jgi:hypothetical protein
MKMLDMDSMGGVVALLAVVLVFGTPIIIVIAILVHKAARTRRIHQTVVALAEKGLPIPPDLFVDRPSPDNSSPLHKGVILIAVGAGLTIFFLSLPNRHAAWGVGIIPLLIGVGYLIVWKLGRQEAGQGLAAAASSIECNNVRRCFNPVFRDPPASETDRVASGEAAIAAGYAVARRSPGRARIGRRRPARLR